MSVIQGIIEDLNSGINGVQNITINGNNYDVSDLKGSDKGKWHNGAEVKLTTDDEGKVIAGEKIRSFN